MWATHVRRTDAPGVPLDDADHTGRTRRAESARAVSSFAVRGTLRIAPAAATGRGTPGVLHAYDGASGKRLWNSASSMTTFASPGSFWSSMGQVYVGTHDGTIYSFGFNDERRPNR